ncbi:hypothetical protein FB45DRAFT_889494 [Roridomyces roridus]|uniref:Chromo domain-containing protein n=1 Tax=Roridomyces roridus TaxID=1738132 RepID=A0AAD7G2T2_9AGAR|nr:hypothetical protein FB45DRAFT_889494 [Roridomyces roridus]
MPAASNETFYVDKVDKAKVEKGPGGKKVWVFHTLWKGYPNSAASWVQERDFNGSYALDIFWKRSDVGDRDPKNLTKFTIGEVVQLREEREKRGSSRSY